MPPTLFQELCYGEFIKDFISTLKEIFRKYKEDYHIEKVYKDMDELTKICPKLQVSFCLLLGEAETSFLLQSQPEAQWDKGLFMAHTCHM